MKNDLLRSTSCHKRNKACFQLFLRHQIFFLFRHLHHISQRAHRSRHNCNFLYRLSIFLQSRCQRMTYLMISNNPLFFLTKYPVFFLLSCNDNFNRFKQIRLIYIFSAIFYCVNRRFINHIRQIRSNGSRSSKRNCIQINRFIHQNIFRMHFERLDSSFQIRFFHNNPPVKAPRTQQRFIKHFWPIGCRKY